MRFVLLLALVACKSEPSVYRGSCQTKAGTQCEEYEGDKKFVDGQRASCAGIGLWSDDLCPSRPGGLGSCRETHGWIRTRHHYVGGNVPIDRAKVECGAYGTWLEPK